MGGAESAIFRTSLALGVGIWQMADMQATGLALEVVLRSLALQYWHTVVERTACPRIASQAAVE